MRRKLRFDMKPELIGNPRRQILHGGVISGGPRCRGGPCDSSRGRARRPRNRDRRSASRTSARSICVSTICAPAAASDFIATGAWCGSEIASRSRTWRWSTTPANSSRRAVRRIWWGSEKAVISSSEALSGTSAGGHSPSHCEAQAAHAMRHTRFSGGANAQLSSSDIPTPTSTCRPGSGTASRGSEPQPLGGREGLFVARRTYRPGTWWTRSPCSSVVGSGPCRRPSAAIPNMLTICQP